MDDNCVHCRKSANQKKSRIVGIVLVSPMPIAFAGIFRMKEKSFGVAQDYKKL
jgi:uncharacterized membrane protein